MLRKFRHLIYQSKSDIAKIEEDCIVEVMKHFPEYSRQEIMDIILSDQPTDVKEDFDSQVSMIESTMLFEQVAKMFGTKLWQKKAFYLKTCRSKCPFGEICDKKLIKAGSNIFCYGQMYIRNISESDIYSLAANGQVLLVDSTGNTLIDLSHATKFQEEEFGNFMFKYQMYVLEFGNYGKKQRINGIKFISLLM